MSPTTTSRVNRFVASLERDRVAARVVAVAVCGSAARGEDVTRAEDGSSDVDMMVITRSRSPLLGRRIARLLARHGQEGLEGGLVPLGTLKRFPTVLNYEARWTGVVVFGDRAVLQTIPMASPQDIPQWEAARLLLNRAFEHVKLRAGLTTPALAVAKSYESLGEAQLITEGRYRPSFLARWKEISGRPLPDLVPDLQAKYERTLALRRGELAALPESPEDAWADLALGLSTMLSLHSGQTGTLDQQLALIGRRERNITHRLYWTAVCAVEGRPRPHQLLEDPAVTIWRRGLALLAGTEVGNPAELVRDWSRCPQILRSRFEP